MGSFDTNACLKEKEAKSIIACMPTFVVIFLIAAYVLFLIAFGFVAMMGFLFLVVCYTVTEKMKAKFRLSSG